MLKGVVRFCKVLYFFVIFGVDRPTERPTDLGIKAPSQSLKWILPQKFKPPQKLRQPTKQDLSKV